MAGEVDRRSRQALPEPDDGDSEVEIRPVSEDDLGAALTPERREQKDKLRAEVEHRTGDGTPR